MTLATNGKRGGGRRGVPRDRPHRSRFDDRLLQPGRRPGRLDRDVEAAAALREVIRINPNHYNARYNLGELFRLEGKYDEAVTQFREYLRLAPDTPQNRRNITRAKGFIQQFEDPNATLVPTR